MIGRHQPDRRRIKRLRAQVLNDCNDTCALCGGHLDIELGPRLPGSPEMDHVLSLAAGGDPYDIANCQATHRACNRAKSSGLSRRGERATGPYLTERSWSCDDGDGDGDDVAGVRECDG